MPPSKRKLSSTANGANAAHVQRARTEQTFIARVCTFATLCAQDPSHARDLTAFLNVSDNFEIAGRRTGAHGFEYRVGWFGFGEDDVDEVAHVWARREHFPAECHPHLSRSDAVAEGRSIPRPAPDPRVIAVSDHIDQAALMAIPDRALSTHE